MYKYYTEMYKYYTEIYTEYLTVPSANSRFLKSYLETIFSQQKCQEYHYFL